MTGPKHGRAQRIPLAADAFETDDHPPAFVHYEGSNSSVAAADDLIKRHRETSPGCVPLRAPSVAAEIVTEGVTVTSQTAEAAPISVGIGETVTSLQAGGRLELHAGGGACS